MMSAILDRVKASVLPDRQPDVDPIAELARLHSRFIEIGQATDRLLAALTSVREETSMAYRAFTTACETEDQETIKAAMDRWLNAAPRWEHAQREYLSLQAQKNYGSTFLKFKAEFPDARDVLLRAVEHRLVQAKQHAATVLVEEMARMKPEGFDEETIRDSTRCKRANGRVSHLETVKRRIETETIEATWRQLASQLLK
jgi:hypothetical protein